MSTLSREVAVQSEAVAAIAEAAGDSRAAVRGGTRELAAAAARPSALRDAVLALLAALAAVLVFLDWFSP